MALLFLCSQRFGLFSHPVGLAVGDDSYYNPARNRKGEDGVVIEQPNFLTSPMKSGKNDDTLF